MFSFTVKVNTGRLLSNLNETLKNHPWFIQWIDSFFPGGKWIKSNTYQCSNIDGGEGSSLKIDTGKGVWKDFGSGDKGGDLISLFSQKNRLSYAEGAEKIENFLGLKVKKQKKGSYKRDNVKFKLENTYSYKDKDGNEVFRIDRYIIIDGPKKGKKLFKQYYKENGDWVRKKHPHQIPYNLQILHSIKDLPVLVVEGEKCVEIAQNRSKKFVVTTWPGGSSNVNHVNFEALEGRVIYLFPDNDDPGKKAMNSLWEKLKRPDRVYMVDVFDLPDAGDVEQVPEDWDFDKWVFENSEKLKTAEDVRIEKQEAALKAYNLKLLERSEEVTGENVFDYQKIDSNGMYYSHCVIMSSGPKSSRKSLGNISYLCRENIPFHYYSYENTKGTFEKTVIRLNSQKTAKWLNLKGLSKKDFLNYPYHLLESKIIVFDPFPMKYIDNDNAFGEVSEMVEHFIQIAEKTGQTFLFFKNQTTKIESKRDDLSKIMGSSAWVTVPRIINITLPVEPGSMVFMEANKGKLKENNKVSVMYQHTSNIKSASDKIIVLPVEEDKITVKEKEVTAGYCETYVSDFKANPFRDVIIKKTNDTLLKNITAHIKEFPKITKRDLYDRFLNKFSTVEIQSKIGFLKDKGIIKEDNENNFYINSGVKEEEK